MSKQRRYWDSTAFIAFFGEEEGRVDLCQGVLDAFDDDFLRLDGQLRTLDNTPIRIGGPDLPFQTRLDL